MSAPSATSPASSTPPAEAAPGPAREAVWRGLFRHLAAHCRVDALDPSDYALRWLNYGLPRSAAPPDAPWPSREVLLLPAAGSAPAIARARDLERRLAGSRTSHVVDCSFVVQKRACRGCRPTGPTSIEGLAHYVAYLPAALFTEPERVRSLLLYAPGGGKGGRSRPVLTEVPGKTIYDSYAGGLETKRRIDAWAAAHPDRTPPIFVALQSNGDEHENGPIEYLTHDVPAHVADAFLGGRRREELVVGAEGVSSGSRQVVLALRAKPAAFDVVGLSCMSCGPIDPDKGRLGSRAELAAWSAALGERVKRGALRVRFAIGARDNQLACNRRLHELWRAGGVFRDEPAAHVGCEPGKAEDERTCDTRKDGFATYRGELHDYRFLSRSWDDELEFLLGALAR